MTSQRRPLLAKPSEISISTFALGTQPCLVLAAKDLSSEEASLVVSTMLDIGTVSARIEKSDSDSGTYTVNANFAMTNSQDIPLVTALDCLKDLAGNGLSGESRRPEMPSSLTTVKKT